MHYPTFNFLPAFSIALFYSAGPNLARAGDVTSSVEIIGNPASSFSSYARNVWDLQAFDGKLFIGAGDSAGNAGGSRGGIPIYTYLSGVGFSTIPVSNGVGSDMAVDEEQIERFVVLDNKLYIPGHDPLENWSKGNYYEFEEGADSFTKHRTIPDGIHTYDLALVNNDLYASIGTEYKSSNNGLTRREQVVLRKSLSPGSSWQNSSRGSFTERYIDDSLSAGLRAYELISFSGDLFSMEVAISDLPPPPPGMYSFSLGTRTSSYTHRGSNPDNLVTGTAAMMKLDKTTGIFGPTSLKTSQIFPGFSFHDPFVLYVDTKGDRLGDTAVYINTNKNTRISRDTEFLGQLVYACGQSNNDHAYVPAATYKASPGFAEVTEITPAPNTPGELVRVWDIKVIQDSLLMLSAEPMNGGNQFRVAVHMTKDLMSWTELFSFTSNAFARSFEFYDGDFYFGLGYVHSSYPDSKINKTKSESGRILRVDGAPYLSVLGFDLSPVAPTAINLSDSVIHSNDPTGSAIGILYSTDFNPGDVHTYTIVGGDSSSFVISADKLFTAGVFDPDIKNSYEITIRSTDQGGLFYDKSFTISVIRATTRLADGAILLGDDSSAYGTGQDGSGSKPTSITISADKRSATITGNVWKRFPFIYTVTTDTVVEFTVSGSDTGELLGISLDNDNTNTNTGPGSSKRVFLIGGSDASSNDWANLETPLYTNNAPAQTYIIPVGTFFTGAVANLGLIGDDDANGSTKITFGNIRLYEAGTPEGYATISGRFDWGNTPVADRDADDDANKNGVSNLMEFAFNMSPTAPGGPTTLKPGSGTSGMPSVSVITPATPTLRIEYLRRKNSGLNYKVKFSDDLVTWEDAVATPTPTSINTSWDRMVMPDTTGSGRKKRFARVEVNE